jgi:hypothetical protein
MRFGELRGLSSLPIPLLRDQFRYEEVLTVLPAADATTGRETLFVATRPQLAILTTVPMLPGQWMTRWAPWGSVAVREAPQAPAGDDVFRLETSVGGRLFHTQLRGEVGRKALRDFIVAVRTCQPVPHTRG